MEEKQVVFRTFSTREDAEALSALLSENGIIFKITQSEINFDPSTLNSEVNKKNEIFIHQTDVAKAEEILLQQAEKLLMDIEPDYYLLSFSDEELIDIVRKQDEWNAFDYLLAKKLINQRGIQFDEQKIKEIQQERLDELAEPEKVKLTWIIVGYFLALFGSIFGMIIGYSFWQTKKTLPNGEKIYNYSKKDREHGLIMFVFGTLGLIIVLIRILIKNGSYRL